MKKCLPVLFLCAVLLFTGCNQPDPIIGTWAYLETLDSSQSALDVVESDMEFYEDGTFVVLDFDSYGEWVQADTANTYLLTLEGQVRTVEIKGNQMVSEYDGGVVTFQKT